MRKEQTLYVWFKQTLGFAGSLDGIALPDSPGHKVTEEFCKISGVLNKTMVPYPEGPIGKAEYRDGLQDFFKYKKGLVTSTPHLAKSRGAGSIFATERKK